MLLSFLEERDLPRRGREARDWLTADEGDVARRGRAVREWLTADERRRVIGLVIVSVAVSLLLSLLATAVVGFVERRRAGCTADGAAVDTADAQAPEPGSGGVPVMGAEAGPEAEPAPA